MGKYDSLQDAWYVEAIRRHPDLSRTDRMAFYDVYLSAFDAYRRSKAEIKSDAALKAVKGAVKGKNTAYAETVLTVFEELQNKVSVDYAAQMYAMSKSKPANTSRHA